MKIITAVHQLLLFNWSVYLGQKDLKNILNSYKSKQTIAWICMQPNYRQLKIEMKFSFARN